MNRNAHDFIIGMVFVVVVGVVGYIIVEFGPMLYAIK